MFRTSAGVVLVLVSVLDSASGARQVYALRTDDVLDENVNAMRTTDLLRENFTGKPYRQDTCCCKDDDGKESFCNNIDAVKSLVGRTVKCCKPADGNGCRYFSGYRHQAENPMMCVKAMQIASCRECLEGGRSWCTDQNGKCVSSSSDCRNIGKVKNGKVIQNIVSVNKCPADDSGFNLNINPGAGEIRVQEEDDVCCCKDNDGTSGFCSNSKAKLWTPEIMRSERGSSDSWSTQCCKRRPETSCRRRFSGGYKNEQSSDMCYPGVNDCFSCVGRSSGKAWCTTSEGGVCVSNVKDCVGDATQPPTWIKTAAGCKRHFDGSISDVRMVVGKPTIPANALPERALFERLQRKGVDKLRYNSGIAFTGGGSRAYVPVIATMRALDQLGLLNNLRYTIGASAAAWGTSLYSFLKDNNSFPEVKIPSEWTTRDLGDFENGLGQTGGEALFDIMERKGVGLANKLVSEGPWPSWVIKHIFRPTYLNAQTVIAADDFHAKYLATKLKDFPTLKIVKPRHDYLPYFISGAAILGPKKLLPFKDEDSFESMECSPLYIGSIYSHRAEYRGTRALGSSVVRGWNAGIVETYAFGNGVTGETKDWTQTVKRHNGYFEGHLEVNLEAPIRLLDMLSASSAAPAAFVAMTHGIHGFISGTARPQVNIDPDSMYREVHKMMFGDGGAVANIPIYQLLQRKVKCIVAQVSQGDALDVEWAKEHVKNGAAPKVGQVDWSLASLFGVMMEDADKNGCDGGQVGCQVKFGQVFPRESFKDLLKMIIEDAADGLDYLHTMQLTTVENKYWGIEAGTTVRVTFNIMTMSKKWEAMAIKRMQDLGHPGWNWNDFKCGDKNWRQHYSTKHEFPHGPTFGMTFKSMCRLFAAFHYQRAGWVINENEQTFRDALEHEECLDPTWEPVPASRVAGTSYATAGLVVQQHQTRSKKSGSSARTSRTVAALFVLISQLVFSLV